MNELNVSCENISSECGISLSTERYTHVVLRNGEKLENLSSY